MGLCKSGKQQKAGNYTRGELGSKHLGLNLDLAPYLLSDLMSWKPNLINEMCKTTGIKAEAANSALRTVITFGNFLCPL